ncbi:hypothetical protein LUZ60_013289 [Juncus effusus]|nr:hypothetical protein LUZ60_013289 [Juncus effusus]
MGSGDWFKSIVGKKKSKLLRGSDGKKAIGIKRKNFKFLRSNSTGSSTNIEELAAIRIQTAFRRFKARKALRCLRGIKRLKVVAQSHAVNKQASITLDYIQSWNRIQTEVRNRRAFMVTEGRNKQKKQENQQKLEAKIHDLEVEWCGGSESMDEIMTRIQQREEASVKRERTMAYAFSHQWRARPGLNLGPFIYETGKGVWGWSWMDRWIAARPWEPRVPIESKKSKKNKPKMSVLKALSLTNIDGKGSVIKNPSLHSEEKKERKTPKIAPKEIGPSKIKSTSVKTNKE